MMENIRNIASRIRELRGIAGISPETAAAELGVTRDTYRDYESGEADIPVSFLCKVAHRFGIELTDLLTGESPRLHIYTLVRKDRGVGVERSGQYRYESLAHNFVHKKAEPFLVTVEPDPERRPELRNHPGQEFDYVLQGTLKVVVGGHELVLEEGDSLFFDSGFDHLMVAMNNRPARFLAVIL